MATFLFAAALLADPSASPTFESDVLPILTKHGCNSGSCHGAATGRGGFRLSLYAGDAAADYASIVREQNGRRVNLSRPDRSLLLLKPVEEIAHAGGNRFDMDSESYAILRRWITNGVPRSSAPSTHSIDVTQKIFTATQSGQTFSYAVHVGEDRTDVTRWCVVRPQDESACEVDQQKHVIKPLRAGQHVIVVRYMNQIASISVLVPHVRKHEFQPANARSNFIDQHVNSMLNTLKIPPSVPSGDAEFHRRLRLDLTGRLPTGTQINSFQEDRRTDKRERLIDQLLASPEFTEFWTFRLAKLLRIRPQPQDEIGASKFYDWLRKKIASQAGYNQIVAEMLTASGDTHEIGPANFYRVQQGARQQAEYVSETLLGVQLRCANCHNHPLDRWTQDDYHGLAAIFAKVRSGRTVLFNSNGEVSHPRTGEAAAPRIPGLRFLAGDGDQRIAFSDWLTADDNRYLSRSIVNRLWAWTFGKGIVHPVDDFRATNPATHPELLDQLAQDFVANGFRIRHTLRVICNSRAYQRSSRALDDNKSDTSFASHAAFRPLEAEVLMDAIADVTGARGKAESRAIDMFNSRGQAPLLKVLGQCDRAEACPAPSAPDLSQALQLVATNAINGKLAGNGGFVERLLQSTSNAEEIVTTLYLRALSREPQPKELRFAVGELKAAESMATAVEDLAWALLTCREFASNH